MRRRENDQVTCLYRTFVALIALKSLCLAAPVPPPIMLWAWERPGDLTSLPSGAGVAYLASTIQLRAGEVRTVPRLQPLRLLPRTFRLAVIRIEAAPGKIRLSTLQRKAAVDAIVDTVRITRPDGVQIDFDARVSERPFYADLLRDLRTALGPDRFLSITALVSWCGAKSWIDRLPVDEVVPMTFEMGAASAAVETLLRSGGQFENPACRQSIGVAAGDLRLRQRKNHRTYVFAYEDWTTRLARSVVTRLQRP